MCPASGNPHFLHINEKKKIKEKSIEQEGTTEQNVSIQARKICLLVLKLRRVMICLYKHIR